MTRLLVHLVFADGFGKDVEVDVSDPSMIVNDESGAAGRLFGDLLIGDLIEAHGPVAAPPRRIRPPRPERDDEVVGGPVAAGRSARSAVAAARSAA